MNNPTLADAVEFIKKYGDLKHWEESDIINLILEAIPNNTLSWSLDSFGNLNGMIVGKITAEKELYIVTATLKDKGLFKHFVRKFKELFPGFTLVGYRKTKVVNFTHKVSLLERL